MAKQLKIFLATDYSDSVRGAEHYALQFAEKTNAFLSILHVYDVPFSLPSNPNQYADAADRLRKSELLRLKQHFNDLMHSAGVNIASSNCECIVLEGSVSKQVNKESESAHMDIVITGTHDAGGFRKLLGGHTWDIIKKSQVPVLSIPQDAVMANIKSIVFATEYRKGELPGLRFLVQLAKHFDAELKILHVTNDALSLDFEKSQMEKFLSEIQTSVPYDKLTLELVHSTSIVEGLNKFCLTSKTDWLVMSHAKPSFLENVIMPSKSVTKEMSFQTQIPLLTIPDYYVALHEN